MEKLLDSIVKLVAMISNEKVQSVASRLQKAGSDKSAFAFTEVLQTPAALGVAKQVISAWHDTTINASELAYMLLTASHVNEIGINNQRTELVWTGPVTPFVSARRTEQALIEVISSAEKTLFLT
ncbi:phospholipase, partial [Alkalimonas collagenimarina]|nr:phospholipase [Alkalimonas collagenimarina]